jgi:mono/diheme cytochrome c family protein
MCTTRAIRQGLMLAGVIAGVVMTFDGIATADPAQVAAGETVYGKSRCAACHMIQGKGGKSGGDLSDVGAKRDTEWLKTFLTDPKSLMPKSRHPTFRGSDEELQALVAYMESLK